MLAVLVASVLDNMSTSTVDIRVSTLLWILLASTLDFWEGDIWRSLERILETLFSSLVSVSFFPPSTLLIHSKSLVAIVIRRNVSSTVDIIVQFIKKSIVKGVERCLLSTTPSSLWGFSCKRWSRNGRRSQERSFPVDPCSPDRRLILTLT